MTARQASAVMASEASKGDNLKYFCRRVSIFCSRRESKLTSPTLKTSKRPADVGVDIF